MIIPKSSPVFEKDSGKLSSQIEGFFETSPGDQPLEKRNKKIIAAILPNLSYNIAGNSLAWDYKEIAETPLPATYILLVPLENSVSDKIVLSANNLSTPLGIIRNNRNIMDRIKDPKIFNSLLIDEKVYSNETSVALQLPFIQYINKKYSEPLKVFPILSSTLDINVIKGIAKKLSEIDNAVFLASSNILHYGTMFDYTPFRFNAKGAVDNLVNSLTESILSLNTEAFLKVVNENKLPIAGASSIAILLETLKLKKITNSELLLQENYFEKDNIISFASIIYHEN